MKVEQIYTGCLAEAAYYISSKGEAAIIDPLRDPKPYIQRAERDGVTIKYVLLTHFHADFVSGQVDLAKQTGATIVFGPTAKPGYEALIASDGQVLNIGDLKLEVLHTPGHTMESSTYLLKDEEGKDHCIFSGDTLFIGDVGRPDLAVKSDLTKEDLAGMLFESLRNKIMPLSDDIIVYPNHGAGSACGKNMSKETFATLGNQKETNYALRADMTKEEFVEELLDGIAAPPQYFPKNAAINRSGEMEDYEKVLERGTVPLDVDTFRAIANHEGAIVLDTRNQTEFVKESIPGSIFIGIDGGFAPWVGALISDLNQAFVLITQEGREEEVVMRLSRVGYDNALGYLSGGLDAWKNAGLETQTIESISPEAFAANYTPEMDVADVRKPSEYFSEHVEGAVNLPLDFINETMDDWDKNKTYYIHCAGGYRSVIAASILASRGFDKLINIEGGFTKMKETNLPHTAYRCASEMK
jgi:glyoxylase-like metal-dependent hydrolase (beta-lactamase superfamily II)/rhodanese-related sulfurtransferase